MELKRKVGRLKQLRHLKKEVDQLSQRIARLEALTVDKRGDGAELTALRERLEGRRRRCMALLGAMYAFIDDIDDSLTRQIMACRYIDGCTWRQVAGHIGERDEQVPRRLHNRFLAKAALPGELDEEEKKEEEKGI